MSDRIENVVIVGSGPAGYTAALYTSRANLEPLVVEGFMWGGLLQTTTDVENYPGFPEGIMGPELMQKLRDQAERFGTRFLTDEATELRLADEPGGIHEVVVGGETIKARTVVLSMGAEHKKLGVPGEEELANQGVSYCATCDAAFFRDRVILVVGGGDSAFEEAIFLSKFGSKVVLVHRRDEFRASKIMVDRARAAENLELKTPFVVEELHHGEGPYERVATLRNTVTGETEELAFGGAFIAIGHEPQSAVVRGQIDVDDEGYVKVQGRSTRTNKPGVFAAGDLVDHTYRQAITAAGSGCQAALDAEWYLRDTPEVPTPESIPHGDLAEAQWAATRS
ncbi:thioredoxin-disulfide reductase [Conexibacter sp. SYSU D00693]|uniref:thioredoxin-disulfide reductase n=1 Tax=Conexibacter sp. SYSU D00693 TaxID=2812560 RepID=UPI00196AE5A1|nr:thioredoxin-disulfide reductase [Conexibacter sp. SYSU D00693]